MASRHFVLPGDPSTRTGGFIYDKRILEGLRTIGLEVALHCLPDGFPEPSAEVIRAARDLFEGLPDGASVVVDGLALGVLPEIIKPHSQRLELIALVHHPLAAEKGLSADRQKELFQSEKAALELASRVITTSLHTAQSLADYGVAADRITAVHPGVDPAPLAEGSKDDAFSLLCVANLVPRKGHDVLIAALAQLTDLEWHLTCAGSFSRDPGTTALLRRRCSESGLEQRIDFVGELDDAGLERNYVKADLFVLASHYEGYGMVLSEAVAHGIPVVATRTGGIPEAVPAEASILLPPGDAKSLAATLRRLITEPGAYAELLAGAHAARTRQMRWTESAKRFAQAAGWELGN